MIDHVVILAPRGVGETIAAQIRGLNPEIACSIAETDAELKTASQALSGRSLLLSHGTSVIVSADILTRFDRRAIHVHSASPAYPGRDPHHFAVYDGARRYGVTAHRMAASVDSGEIIAVREFDVEHPITPQQLLEQANCCAGSLIRELLPNLLADQLDALPDAQWRAVKKTRRDFLQLCKVPPYVDKDELERRKAATDWGGRKNLYFDLHGLRFRLEGRVPDHEATDIAARWSEFTEEGYAELLDLACSRYRFASFNSLGEHAHVLWRHDLDFSVHRAAKIAEIEAEKGVIATYFVMLRSDFYALHDADVRERLQRIKSFGHRFGLHFQAEPRERLDIKRDLLEARIRRDAEFLQDLIGVELDAVSFHNPDTNGLIDVDNNNFGNLVNTYGSNFRKHYGYCSDSNGYWRHRALADVLKEGKHTRLQVLTHPGWWTPNPMPPRARLERCVLGRANAVMRDYDSALCAYGRQNIR